MFYEHEVLQGFTQHIPRTTTCYVENGCRGYVLRKTFEIFVFTAIRREYSELDCVCNKKDSFNREEAIGSIATSNFVIMFPGHNIEVSKPRLVTTRVPRLNEELIGGNCDASRVGIA